LKAFLAIFCMTAAAAFGFDSEAWLAKRAALDADAQRMRSVWSECSASATSPAENLAIPIDLYEDGSPKFVLKAEKAQIFIEEKLVWAEGVEAMLYDRRGAVSARATAANCVIDRRTECGWCEGRARVDYGAYSLEGEGLYFSKREGFAKIFDSVSMRASGLDAGGKSMKALLGDRARKGKGTTK